MTDHMQIPVFALFGETNDFPDLVHCEDIKDRAREHGWVISPHRHSRMAQLLIVESGGGSARIDEAEISVTPNSFFYIPQNAVHGFSFSSGTVGKVYSFPTPVLASVAPSTEAIRACLARPSHGQTSEKLAGLAGLLVQALADNSTHRAQLVVSLAHAVLAAFAECAQPQDAKDPARRGRVEELDRLITAHLGQGWKPSDFATAMSITTGQLTRICQAAHQQSASIYIEAAHMAEAARLLAFTQIPVAEVGYRLGFTDPSYFSRRFRLVYDLSPSDYRQRFVQ